MNTLSALLYRKQLSISNGDLNYPPPLFGRACTAAGSLIRFNYQFNPAALNSNGLILNYLFKLLFSGLCFLI